MRVVICEDCPQQMKVILALMKKYCHERPGTEIETYSFVSGYELLKNWNEFKNFDLLLLDILMPGLSGIELAQELRARGAVIPIVFLTASQDYALEAFGVFAVQYLLKPLSAKSLFLTLDKVMETSENTNEPFFVLSKPERIVKIPNSSIVYAELSDRTLRITLNYGTAISSKTLRVPFAKAVASLLKDERFLYVHQSFVINMDWANELTCDSFVMHGDITIPVPRKKYAKAKAAYLTYLLGKNCEVNHD